MKQIIFGTKNQAKLKQISGALAPLKIIVSGLPDVNLPDIAEDGTSAQANAKKKALSYAKTLGQPVLSMDNALYFDNLPDNQQPGLNVRRINNGTERPSDEAMLEYYQKLVNQLSRNGQTAGHWEFALCYARPDGETKETTIISPRIFTSQASQQRIDGYPLESIQIDPESGRYISEMSADEQDQFWQKMIGAKLCEFIQNIN
jgi:inosine/xanthosine triphosphate pyrophosphatase family protein